MDDLLKHRAARLVLLARLPPHAVWHIDGDEQVFDFSRCASPLRPIDAGLYGGPLDPAWSMLRVFGECDINAGAGAQPMYCVHAEEGSIWEIDVDRSGEELSILNSSAECFAQSFCVIDAALRDASGPNVSILVADLAGIDPDVFERSAWRSFVEYLDWVSKADARALSVDG